MRLGERSVGNHPALRRRLDELFAGYNAEQIGSSTRIAHFSVLEEPPSLAESEITDKGYLNQRRVLARRSEIVEEMYAQGGDIQD